MRNVPELRFDGFDGEWEEKILGNCIKLLKSGLSRKLSDYDIGVPVVRANNTFDNKLDMDNDVKYWYEDDPQGANTDNYAIQKNDILINFINSKSKMGTAAIVETIPNRKTIYTTNIMRVVLSDDLNPYYFLMITLTTSYRKYIDAISMPAVNQSSFTTADYKKLKFNSPCIDEQEKIGDLFKKIDDLIEIQEDKVSKMEDFKKSMLQKMFPKKGELVPEFRFDGFDGGWIVVSVKDLGKIVTGNTPKTNVPEYWSENHNHVWVTPTDINGPIINNSERYLTDLGVEVSRLIPENSVLITSIASIGKNSINTIPVSINQQINAIIPSESSPYFIMMAFERYIQIFKSLAGNTATQIINKTNFENFCFPVPNLEEQEKIGQFFKNLDSQIENEEKLLESYKMMKKSLLQKMFV